MMFVRGTSNEGSRSLDFDLSLRMVNNMLDLAHEMSLKRECNVAVSARYHLHCKSLDFGSSPNKSANDVVDLKMRGETYILPYWSRGNFPNLGMM